MTTSTKTPTSQAKTTFDDAIRDAEDLLSHFNQLNSHPPPPNIEVLKRAGLIMAFTAWETYVEDRAREALAARLAKEGDGPSTRFVEHRLDEELKRFHNPNSDKTRRLFFDYLEVDVTKSWNWNQYDVAKVKATLDDLIGKRGDAVHRSIPRKGGPPTPHLVTKEELRRSINFLKALVEATEKALSSSP
jgi:hypothetical protein